MMTNDEKPNGSGDPGKVTPPRPKMKRMYYNLGDGDENLPSGVPRSAVMMEFAKRLQARMLAKGWNQSELARHANMGRDNISGYIRGLSLPGPVNLSALCQALECSPEDLIPLQSMPSVENNIPPLDIREVGDGRAWLRVNQAVDWPVAVKILQLLKEGT